jgi:hypothetical protein
MASSLDAMSGSSLINIINHINVSLHGVFSLGTIIDGGLVTHTIQNVNEKEDYGNFRTHAAQGLV